MSVNMFGLAWRIEAAPRTKKGQPPQRTTGVASASWIQVDEVPCIDVIASATSGALRMAQTQSRRVMSASSGSGPSTAATDIGSSAMPHLGQEPGPSRTISGCIGQGYLLPVAGGGGGGGWA